MTHIFDNRHVRHLLRTTGGIEHLMPCPRDLDSKLEPISLRCERHIGVLKEDAYLSEKRSDRGKPATGCFGGQEVHRPRHVDA